MLDYHECELAIPKYPFHFLDNFRNTSQTQVVPDVDDPEKVSKTTKQASS
jgi:hypothetical protein